MTLPALIPRPSGSLIIDGSGGRIRAGRHGQYQPGMDPAENPPSEDIALLLLFWL
jgi:hypothetical protein